jgi:hypothetical protein
MSEGLKQLHEEQARQCIWNGLVGIVCYKHMLLDDEKQQMRSCITPKEHERHDRD